MPVLKRTPSENGALGQFVIPNLSRQNSLKSIERGLGDVNILSITDPRFDGNKHVLYDGWLSGRTEDQDGPPTFPHFIGQNSFGSFSSNYSKPALYDSHDSEYVENTRDPVSNVVKNRPGAVGPAPAYSVQRSAINSE